MIKRLFTRFLCASLFIVKGWKYPCWSFQWRIRSVSPRAVLAVCSYRGWWFCLHLVFQALVTFFRPIWCIEAAANIGMAKMFLYVVCESLWVPTCLCRWVFRLLCLSGHGGWIFLLASLFRPHRGSPLWVDFSFRCVDSLGLVQFGFAIFYSKWCSFAFVASSAQCSVGTPRLGRICWFLCGLFILRICPLAAFLA